MVFCQDCGKLNDNSSNFCINCGSKLIKKPIKCLKCGEINESDSNFCINCGNDLKPTRKEYEQEIEKIRENINTSDFGVVSIGGKTIGNNKIEKDNPNLGKKDVKFKSMDYGLDIGKNLNEKLDEMVIENYGTNEEKAELKARKDKEKEKILKQKPIHATFKKADKLFMNHNHKEAIPEFRYVIDNSEIYDETVSLSYSFLSDCYVFLDDYDKAIEVLNEHLEVKKEFNEDYQKIESQIERVKQFKIDSKVKGLRQEGVKLFYGGNFDEAIPLFEECIDLKCDDSQIYNLLANIYIRNRDFESAKEVLEKAVENVSWEQSLHNEHNTGLADRLEKVNNYLENGNLVAEPLPFDPESMKLEIKNAKKVLKEEDKDKGIELLENIIKKGTYTNTAYYTLYQTYMKDKKYDDAIRISDLAIKYLGLFDQDRLEKWTKYKDKAIAKKEKEISK